MNNEKQQEIRYHLLKTLSQEPNISQREMAIKMGISLGKINYCVGELAKKGLIKIHRFKSAKNKIPYTYVLTPHGLQEKARLTIRYLQLKLSEYEEVKRQIRQLALEVEQESDPEAESIAQLTRNSEIAIQQSESLK